MERATTKPLAGRLLTGLFILPLGAALALGTSSCCKLLDDLKKDKEEPEAEAESSPEEAEAVEESASEEAAESEPAAEAPAAEAEAEEVAAPTPLAGTPAQRGLVPQPPSTVAQPTPTPQPTPQPTATQPAPAETAAPDRVEVGTRTSRRGDRRTETPTGTVIPDRRIRNPGN